MEFIEFSGRTLLHIITDDELRAEDLERAGVHKDSILRVNRQGDLELRSHDGWEVIGGLLGNFDERVRRHTGLDWAAPLGSDSA